MVAIELTKVWPRFFESRDWKNKRREHPAVIASNIFCLVHQGRPELEAARRK